MNRNYDPYKKTILFFLSLISILLMTAVFAYFWYHTYAETMYVYRFYRRGNYAMIGLYALLLYFFSKMYGALRIGQLRRVEVVLSHFLSTFLANFVMYIIICLLAFGFVYPGGMLLMQLIDFVIAAVWTVFASKFYNRIFQPWKILLIYGERPAADLVYKVEARRDKYAIYGAIHVDEGIEAIAEKVREYQAVIIGDVPAEQRNEVLKYCYGQGIRAYVMPKISDIVLMGADQIHVFDTPFMLSKGYALSFEQRFGKRAIDLVITIPLLIITLPFMLLTALAIKLQDGGPVLYRQVRCTKDNREFCIIKFRSMVVGAEQEGEAVLARERDGRITPVGRFIRAIRLDELPQLFNVLKGDMSLVGPRPERPEIIAKYQEEMPEFSFRTRVKAGMTGFAQIYGKYNTVPYDKLKLDLFYIENYSFWMDLKLILMTVKTVLKKEATQGVEEDQTTAMREVAAAEENVEQIVHEIILENGGDHE
ncbi:MAG: sugar transferase [Lachnospiraceae bacterium]|nr:sugar transferase [Lachnospiraceae bacterium]